MKHLCRAAFTLIELMLVLAIFTLFTSLIMLNLNHLNNSQIYQELSLFQAHMQSLQQQAVAQGVQKEMKFALADNTYEWLGHSHALSKHIRFGIQHNIKGPPSNPTHTLTSPCTFADNAVIFYPDGIIRPGTVYLIDSGNRLFALSCAVSSVSFLRKYRYDGKWKLLET